MLKIIFRLFLMPFALLSSGRFLKKAKAFEARGKYKEACYQYGTALLSSIIVDSGTIRNRIKKLWEEHGPFDFNDELQEELIKYGGDTPEHCLEAGHAATVSIIKKIVEKTG